VYIVPRLVLAQIATDAKSNQITAVPRLLKLLPARHRRANRRTEVRLRAGSEGQSTGNPGQAGRSQSHWSVQECRPVSADLSARCYGLISITQGTIPAGIGRGLRVPGGWSTGITFAFSANRGKGEKARA